MGVAMADETKKLWLAKTDAPETSDFADILKKHPDMKKYQGTELTDTIIALEAGNRLIGVFLKLAQKGQPTGDIDFLQGLISRNIDVLRQKNDPALRKFLDDQTAIYKRRQRDAQREIACKTRGQDGVYRPDAKKMRIAANDIPMQASGQILSGPGSAVSF
jgi:hypothetical protein